MKKPLSAILLIILSALTSPAQSGQVEQEIRNIISGSDQAKLTADVAFFERTYTDDYSYTSATGALDNKKTSLEWYRKNLKESSAFKLSSMKSDPQLIRVVGNMAVVTGTWAATIEGTEKNPHLPYVNSGRFTSVLEKRDGRWQIVAEHDSEAPRDRKLMKQEVLRAGRGYNELMRRLKSGRSYVELEKSGDIGRLNDLLAEEYTYTSRDGELSTKAEDLAGYKNNQIKLGSAEFLEQNVRVLGNNTAVETGKIRYVGTNAGKAFDITKRYTTTWIWRGGRWQIAAGHTSAVKQ